MGPALRAGASAAKPLPRDSLVPGVRRAASLFWPDFKTVFVKNKQNSNSGQALEGAAVFFTLTEENLLNVPSHFPPPEQRPWQPWLLRGLRGRVRQS